MKKVLLVFLNLILACFLFSYSDDYNILKNLYEQKQKTPSTQKTESETTETLKNTGIYEFKPKQIEKKEQEIEIVVSASQINENLSLIPRSVNIISNKEFEKYSNLKRAQDILDMYSGINIRKYGPPNSLATVSLRAGKSRDTLIMIDGIPINDLGTQDTDLSLIDLSGVDRIEIIKGGLSSIYGANTSSGVINFLSDSKERKLFLGQLFYGSDNTQKIVLSSNYRISNIDYTVTGSEEKSDGYFKNSNYFKRNANFKTGFGIGNSFTELSGYYAKRDNSIPFNEFGPTPQTKKYDEIYGIGINEILAFDLIKIKINSYLRSGDLKYKDESFNIDDRHIKKEKYIQGLLVYEEGGFFKGITGIDFKNQELNSTKADNNSMNNIGYFGNISLFLFDKLTLNTSGRIDNNEIYGEQKSASIGMKYLIEPSLEIYASTEYAFSVPTLLELFWNEKVVYDFGGGFIYTTEIYGNKNLKTEKSYSYEIGLNKKEKNIIQSITWFKRDVIDLIKWQTETDFLSYDKSIPINIDRARIFGIEVSLKLNPIDFINIGAEYTYLNAIDVNTNKKLPYSPEDKITTFLDLILPFKIKLGLNMQYVDFRFDTKERLIKEYFIYNAYFIQKINENISCNLNIYNLFDNKEYMVINKIPMPGRQILAGIKGEF